MHALVKLTITSFIAGAALAAGFAARAEDRASLADAKAMLAKAVAHLKSSGKDRAYADFMNAQGPFFDRDLRVTVLSLDGRFVANANNPGAVGKDATATQDADGKHYIKERLEIVQQKGAGEQDYKFTNPVSRQLEPKVTYFERVDDVIVAVGAFKP